MKICIVNVGIGRWYPKGQRRLSKSISEHAPHVHQHMMQAYPDGVTHQQVPYGFKPRALQQAARACDPDVVIWLDASAWLTGSVQPLAERAVARGVAVWVSGFTVGQWCADAALPLLGLTREGAFEIPLVQGMPVALHMRDPKAQKMLQMWRGFADAGAFNGPWNNKHQAASSDPRVHGHRHDMPALSVAAHRLQIEPYAPRDLYSTWAEALPATVCVVARGM